jgi:hypothetical protein
VTFAVPVDDTSGRKTTAAEVTFTSFVSAAAANGFFIASNSASGAGDTLLFAANFDSGVARSLATVSDQLKITPTAVFNA